VQYVCSYIPSIVLATDAKDNQFDGVIVVTDSLEHLPTSVQSARQTLENYLQVYAVCFHCQTIMYQTIC